jgi:hypothetical protein
VPRRVVRRHRRTREQELARRGRRIHGSSHLVPQLRLHLPFIQQPGPRALEHQRRIHRHCLTRRQVHIQQHRGGGQLLGHAGLAAGLRALDHHGTCGGQSGGQLGIGDAREIGGGGQRRAGQCGECRQANAAFVGLPMP